MNKKKIIILVLVALFTFSLTGCDKESNSQIAEFVFDKEAVGEFFSVEEDSMLDYEITVESDTVSNIDIINNSFYRVYEDNEFVYYTMNSIELTRQENTQVTEYGMHLIDYNFQGLIAINKGDVFHLYLEDGTFIGEVDYTYGSLYIYDDLYVVNENRYFIYYVEFDYNFRYIIVNNVSENTFEAFDLYVDNFNLNEYLDDLQYNDNVGDGPELIEKRYEPFFDEDDSYYYIVSNGVYLVYDEDDKLINSFSNSFGGYSNIIIGTKIISQQTIEVGVEEPFSYYDNGRRYKLVTMSLDILSGEYSELDLNYILYDIGDFNENFDNNAAILIREIGYGNVLLPSFRAVLINQSGKIISDLLNFSDLTIFDNGYFFDIESNSLFTEDLTLISNQVISFSSEYGVFSTILFSSIMYYNLDGEELIETGYQSVYVTNQSAMLSKDGELYVLDFESETLSSIESFGDLIYSNEYIIVTFNISSNSILVIDSRNLDVLKTIATDGTNPSVVTDFDYSNLNVNDNFTRCLILNTGNEVLIVQYTVTGD